MEFLTELVKLVPGAAIPLVVVILGLYWIYRKTESINKDREDTKVQRDKDSQAIHDSILKLQFKVNELDGRTVHHADVLEDLRAQVATLNANISKLTVQLEMYCNILKDKK